MRMTLMTVQTLVAFTFLVGCGKGDSSHGGTSTIDMSPSEDKVESMIRAACNKPESEIAVSAEAEENKIFIEDQIDTQDIEHLDCQNQVILKESQKPVRPLNKTISIKPPASLKGHVRFVSLQNKRTCYLESADVSTNDRKELPPSNRKEIPANLHVNPHGHVQVTLSDSAYRYQSVSLNVIEGANVLVVRYYGKCLKAKAADGNSEKANKEDLKKLKAAQCEQAEELGSKEILVQVRIRRPQVSGVHRIVECRQKQNDPAKQPPQGGVSFK